MTVYSDSKVIRLSECGMAVIHKPNYECSSNRFSFPWARLVCSTRFNIYAIILIGRQIWICFKWNRIRFRKTSVVCCSVTITFIVEKSCWLKMMFWRTALTGSTGNPNTLQTEKKISKSYLNKPTASELLCYYKVWKSNR